MCVHTEFYFNFVWPLCVHRAQRRHLVKLKFVSFACFQSMCLFHYKVNFFLCCCCCCYSFRILCFFLNKFFSAFNTLCEYSIFFFFLKFVVILFVHSHTVLIRKTENEVTPYNRITANNFIRFSVCEYSIENSIQY